jgi:hypothetical protein
MSVTTINITYASGREGYELMRKVMQAELTDEEVKAVTDKAVEIIYQRERSDGYVREWMVRA